MKFIFRIIILIFTSTLIIQCKKTESVTKTTTAKFNLVEHAEGFSIVNHDNFSILKVKNAYPEAKEVYTYVLHKENAQLPDSLNTYTKVQVPVKKIIVTSTTHIPSLEMLEMENTIVGFPSTHYVSSAKTRVLIDNGTIREIGNNQSLNTELILDLNPDIIIGFSVDGDLKTYKNLEKNRQKIIFNADWTEKTPLGKAEWVKFFGALYDKNDEANTIFSKIKKDYNDALWGNHYLAKGIMRENPNEDEVEALSGKRSRKGSGETSELVVHKRQKHSHSEHEQLEKSRSYSDEYDL